MVKKQILISVFCLTAATSLYAKQDLQSASSQTISMTVETLCGCPSTLLSLFLWENNKNIGLSPVITNVNFTSASNTSDSANVAFTYNPKPNTNYQLTFGSYATKCQDNGNGLQGSAAYYDIYNGQVMQGICGGYGPNPKPKH